MMWKRRLWPVAAGWLALSWAGVSAEARVAILRDDLPIAGAASSPQVLAELLQAAGIGARFLDAAELADPQALNASDLDLVVLPYGATFPLAARDAFVRFLGEGGDFISIGGYAFDHLVARSDNGWLTQEQLASAKQEPMPIGGDFEQAPWQTDRPTALWAADQARSGARSMRVRVEAGAAPLGGSCYHDIAVEPGQQYALAGWVKAGPLGREADGFAFIAAYQYAPDGRLVTFRDIAQVTDPQDWEMAEWRVRIAPGVSRLRIIVGLYNTTGTAWFDDLTLVREPPLVVMNTRSGNPRDGLEVTPQQIGAFDPSYRLERAATARGADGIVFPTTMSMAGPFEGYAASGVVGWNRARWTSLINAYDRYGRVRGSIGALLRNYAGPYARSSWAFFGVANRDLFAPDAGEMGQGFVRLVRLMLAETYLHNLTTDLASYRRGEPVALSAQVSNFGRDGRSVEVRFSIQPWDVVADAVAGPPVALAPVRLAVAAGETAAAEASWSPGALEHDFYRAEAVLLAERETLDRMETGFCVSDESAGASGPAVRFADNYLETDGVRHFLLGTDTYGNMFGAAGHNPLTWARDLGMMRDHGVTVYENLQFNPGSFAQPYVADDRVARQVQGMTQLAQQLGLVYVPGLLIGWNTAASEEDLARQAGWCRDFAALLSDTPGIVYYTNGDLRLDLEDTPEMRALRDDFLREHPLGEAGLAPGEEAPLTPVASRGWDDLRARDRKLFEQWLVRRWLTAMHEALKEGDPDRPTTVEFYGSPFGGIDVRASLGPIDIGNIGYFGLKGSDIAEFPARFKFTDMRAYGQGLSIGEFGAKIHPAWQTARDYHQTRTEDEQIALYLAVPHYALGLGGCKVHNWCWADAPENVFPWGMVHANDRAPKRVLSVYRNQALLFKQFEPQYQPPEVWVVVPTSHRAGANASQVYQAVLRCIGALIAAHADLGVIDEDRLQALPQTARAVWWPLPYCPSDEAVAAIEAFATGGGIVYLSGDITFDPDRRRTRPQRLERLAGVRLLDHAAPVAGIVGGGELTEAAGDWFGLRSWLGRPAVATRETTARVVARGPAGEPRLVVNDVGAGKVVFTPDVLEADEQSMPVLRLLYRGVLELAGVAPVEITPDLPSIHAFAVPTRDGGAAYVLFNADPESPRRVEVRTRHHRYAMVLGAHRPGLVLEDAAGRTLALEGSGSVARDGRRLARGDAHFMLAVQDGRDIAEARALALMPNDAGRIAVATATQPVAAQVGDVVAGRWTAFETLQPRPSNGMIELDIDADRAVSLLVIAPPGGLGAIGQRVADALGRP